MDITMRLLNTNDASSVFAGLHCMLAICRMYRFKGGETRDDFNRIVSVSFPQLLSIGSRLVDETNPDGWEMLRIVFKAYKHTIYVGFGRKVHDEHLLIIYSLSSLLILWLKITWWAGVPSF